MLDLLIVVAFVVYSITVGFRARREAGRNLDEYFLAGRTLPGWQAGTSMAATQFAADTPLLVAGLVATAGVFSLWRLWVYGLAFLLMAYLFAAPWRRSGVLTDAELAEIRYSGPGVVWLRALKAVYYGTLFNCVVLAMVLVAAMAVAETFLPWHAWLPEAWYEPLLAMVSGSGLEITSKAPLLAPTIATTNNLLSIGLIVAFTAAYSMTGGLRSVVRTDVVQFALAMIGMIVFAWYVVDAAGGLAGLADRVTERYGPEQATRMLQFSPGADAAIYAFFAVVSLQWVFQINSDGTGYLAQRSMACIDERHARDAGVIFAWLQIVLRSLPWLLIAIGLLLVDPFSPADAAAGNFAAQRELSFVRAASELMPDGARGLLLVGMLATLASTLDTHMNWGASYWSNDLYDRVLCRAWLSRTPSGRELVAVARISNLVVLSIALVVMTRLSSIQQAWQVTLLFGAGVGPVLILRWLWERTTVHSELAAMATSLVVAPAWLLASVDSAWLQAEPMRAEAAGLALVGAASTAAAVLAARYGPPTDPGTLQRFHRVVRPAGFWATTAGAVGEDVALPRRRLTRALGRVALTGASLYLCLYGAARLLVPLPQGSVLWPAIALGAGLLLMPLWLHLGHRGVAGRSAEY